MEFVLSRRCRHLDWYRIPETSLESCKRCGFTLAFSSSCATGNFFTDVQDQPLSYPAFDPLSTQPLGPHSYRYLSLDLSYGRPIRILVLEAGRPGDPLRCGLKHVNLQQGPIYEALSYTWADAKGDDSLRKRISCGNNGRTIAITANCEAALLLLRREDTDRSLWVDAICIDQSNVLERNHQVKNMIAIFRSAIRVLVYLGQGSSVIYRLFDYIANDIAGLLPEASDFTSLFRNRWFHRVWVIPEVAIAKDVLVVYDGKRMSWNDLIVHSNLFLRMMAEHNLPLVLPPVMSYGLQQTATGSGQSQGRSELLALLQVSRNCSCKDSRDKVYAVLGLLHDQPILPLQANYSPSVTAGWVYLQVAAWHIVTTRSLEILSLVDGLSHLHMPSWVPDWTRMSPVPLPAQHSMLMDAAIPRIKSLQGALGNMKSVLDYPLDCTLQVTGTRCGMVWADNRVFGATLATDKPQRGHSYSKNCTGHWLHAPSPDPLEWNCSERLDFWDQILSAYRSVHPEADFELKSDLFKTDIPPAFGGPCKLCFRFCRSRHFSAFYTSKYKRKPDCYCKSTGSSLGHYGRSELCDFLKNINRYGLGRRMFGTDHSLGLGPMQLEDWDEVWMLEGAKVPFILRSMDDHYKLIGACYVQAFDRKIDSCSVCSGETIRQDLTLRPPLGHRLKWANGLAGPIMYDTMKSGQFYEILIESGPVWMKLAPWIGWTQYTLPYQDEWYYWEIATSQTHSYPPTNCPLRNDRQEITIS